MGLAFLTLGRFRMTVIVGFIPSNVVAGFLSCIGYKVLDPIPVPIPAPIPVPAPVPIPIPIPIPIPTPYPYPSPYPFLACIGRKVLKASIEVACPVDKPLKLAYLGYYFGSWRRSWLFFLPALPIGGPLYLLKVRARVRVRVRVRVS